ncbi:MAG: purine-nucleoside phosphorylase [Actinomyces sp.]|uniref:purine-nucleoside phosphorylase n=1 Tax=Actinomyces sp. TaxID=29317 RepID=UPI0026DBE5B8|nr:purine-nucleoside phosphorylase [Actinomyces sp.]MDO4244290.1 purine-nucleoside phosphorylase [Actinomyces sp.]
MSVQNAAGTWDEDPDGASILLATGRARHDLLVVAEPALLAELDDDWGAPASRVRLSFLPGVSAPGTVGQEDALASYEHRGRGVLIARGRTTAFEGRPARRTTALARTVASQVPAALLVTRATGLGGLAPGGFLPIADHLNLSGQPLFPAGRVLEGSWDESLTATLAELDGVGEPGVVALTPGPLRPTRAEAAVLAGMGAQAAVCDSVAEAMALAARGVRVAGLAYVDAAAPGTGTPPAAGPQPSAPQVVRAAVLAVLGSLR